MTLDLTQFFLLGLLTSTSHWLIARSEIAKPLWSRARGWLDKLLACAGCSGFWLGGLFGGFGVATPVLSTAPDDLTVNFFAQAMLCALFGVFLTPVFESVLLWGLRESAVSVGDNKTGDDETEDDVTDEHKGSIPESAARTDSGAHETPIDNPIRRVRLPEPRKP